MCCHGELACNLLRKKPAGVASILTMCSEKVKKYISVAISTYRFKIV